MATTMYMYDLKTGALTGSRPAQVVNGKEITKSASATTVAPPSDIPAGRIARWTGAAWEIVEDHRQHMDDSGTKQGGTKYWLPGDTHASPARYLEHVERVMSRQTKVEKVTVMRAFFAFCKQEHIDGPEGFRICL